MRANGSHGFEPLAVEHDREAPPSTDVSPARKRWKTIERCSAIDSLIASRRSQRVFAVGPGVREDPVELLPEDDGAGCLSERIDKIGRALRRDESLELPGVARADVIEIPAADADAAPRASFESRRSDDGTG